MSDIKNAVVNKKAFVQAHQRAVREMRAEYEMSKQTRIEAGVTIRTYEEWLEDQLQTFKSLTEYYRKVSGERNALLNFCKTLVDMYERDEYPNAEFAFQLNDLRDWLKENELL